MIKRRAFLGGTLTAMSAGTLRAPSATAQAAIPAPAEPLMWPVVTKLPPGIRSFAGHTDTVPDIVGRIGTPAGLVIFTEGNHLMACSATTSSARSRRGRSRSRNTPISISTISWW
jgi:hypothetical protein